ncbi:MAG: (Fe-S)-binding protein [Rhodospirillaceae bacterium]|jgi:heterodisulfide reductase subunit D|nr:(Fe-S)-binding protein [Rhodospirillaceae bacterium]MBT4042731.1 (Fe-S)-binding protein [Rhodospirillaceae bacterium]MBT4689984.1 (Fe-S)-binding protein [Rhodospirillaceae bacterium]MBT5081156.1 (Fe-S)-binding protein [Rhodospirillaceae bacterium]MBT5523536.1 (Fe-S)-binding protein [Rhodospirillaceae bacterium]
MGLAKQSLNDFLDQERAALIADCTACGKCVEVCPVTPYTDVKAGEEPGVIGGIGGVLGLLRDGTPLAGAAQSWSSQCNGCGLCIPSCPEGVNPRRMLMLANTVEAEQDSPTPQLFRKMSRSIRIMAAMQLAPPEFDKLLRNPRAHPADVVFYTGCNPIRTPHLLFNAMAILDALETDYEVVGGPGACCGIIQSKWEGDQAAGERVVDGTIDRFAGFKPKEVLSWCPSCVLHLGETIAGFRQASFDFDHVTNYLVARAEGLAEKFIQPVNKRVLLHTHDGMEKVGENVARMLSSVPGLTLVGTVSEPGYTCGGSGADRSPDLKAAARAETLARAEAEDVDILVSLYHGCHGQLSGLEAGGKFQVVNWTDLLVQALGQQPHDDISKRYRMQDDWDMVLDEGEIYLKANGVDMDREWLKSLLPDIFGQTEFKGGLEAFASKQNTLGAAE